MMAEDYYDTSERPGTDEQLAESGWRREIGQLLRLEAALAPWDWEAVESVLDLGCGPGYLANYLDETGRAARYVGVEMRRSAVEYARAHVPRDAEVRRGDVYDRDLVDESFDLVVAIGAHVDGTPPDGDADRVARVRRLVERCDELADRAAAVWVLDQEALGKRPALGLDPALFGVTADELEGIVDPLSRPSSIRGDLLETDLGVYLHDGTGTFRAEALGPSVHERVVEHYLERGGRREDVAWLWLEAGRTERARAVLGELVESKGETREIRHLRDRLS